MLNDIFKENEDFNHSLIEECWHGIDWFQWNDAILSKLNSLAK